MVLSILICLMVLRAFDLAQDMQESQELNFWNFAIEDWCFPQPEGIHCSLTALWSFGHYRIAEQITWHSSPTTLSRMR
jgi:hypothetical protein